MKRKWFSDSFLNYILIQMIVILVVVLVLGGYLYQFFYNAMYSEFLSGNRQYLEAVVNRHENDMQVVEDIVEQIGLTEEATRFYLRGQHKKANELKQHLRRYTTVSQFFSLILYSYHKDEHLYNHLSSVETDFLLKGGMVLSDTSQQELYEMFYAAEPGLRILPEQQLSGYWIEGYMAAEKEAVFLIRTVEPEREETLIFIVPGSYYDKLLVNAGEERRCDLLFYDGRLIVHRGDMGEYKEELYAALSEMEVDLIAMEDTGMQREISLGEEIVLLSTCCGTSGIVYATVQDKDVFYAKIQAEQWMIVLIVVVCIILAICITGFFSGRMIKKVKSLGQFLEEPSYDFSNIERGIQTLALMKKESEKENLGYRKAQFIRNFFRGYLSTII